MRTLEILIAGALAVATMVPARAADTGEGFVGYWQTAQGDGVVQLQRCSICKDAPPTALCGVIVWDAESANPRRTAPLDCNRKVFEATKFDAGV